MEMTTKKCSKCGEVKPISEFYKSSSSKDGYQSYCKYCMNHLSKAAPASTEKKEPATQNVSVTSEQIIPSSPKKVYLNEHLATVSNRDLIAEIKARGFTGKLTYVYNIDL